MPAFRTLNLFEVNPKPIVLTYFIFHAVPRSLFEFLFIIVNIIIIISPVTFQIKQFDVQKRVV